MFADEAGTRTTQPVSTRASLARSVSQAVSQARSPRDRRGPACHAARESAKLPSQHATAVCVVRVQRGRGRPRTRSIRARAPSGSTRRSRAAPGRRSLRPARPFAQPPRGLAPRGPARRCADDAGSAAEPGRHRSSSRLRIRRPSCGRCSTCTARCSSGRSGVRARVDPVAWRFSPAPVGYRPAATDVETEEDTQCEGPFARRRRASGDELRRELGPAARSAFPAALRAARLRRTGHGDASIPADPAPGMAGRSRRVGRAHAGRSVRRHAAALVLPRGWELHDERTDAVRVSSTRPRPSRRARRSASRARAPRPRNRDTGAGARVSCRDSSRWSSPTGSRRRGRARSRRDRTVGEGAGAPGADAKPPTDRRSRSRRRASRRARSPAQFGANDGDERGGRRRALNTHPRRARTPLLAARVPQREARPGSIRNARTSRPGRYESSWRR